MVFCIMEKLESSCKESVRENNIIPYDKFKSIFANMVNAMKAKIANYNV